MINFKGRFEALQTAIAGLDAWSSWVGGSPTEEELKARITWPIRSATLNAFPFINFSPGSAMIASNTGGYQTSANFQRSGSFMFRLWDADSDPNDPTASFNDFESKLTALFNDWLDVCHDGPVILRQFDNDDLIIVHSGDNAFILNDDDDTDDQPTWHACVEIQMGVP